MAVQERFVVDAKGHKTGVILSMKRCQKLMKTCTISPWLPSAAQRSR